MPQRLLAFSTHFVTAYCLIDIDLRSGKQAALGALYIQRLDRRENVSLSPPRRKAPFVIVSAHYSDRLDRYDRWYAGRGVDTITSAGFCDTLLPVLVFNSTSRNVTEFIH